MTPLKRFFAALLALALALAAVPSQAREQPYSQAELDQMLAPIALYPDPLLSQVLMASTYPIEVVEAARWSRAHPGLKGDDAVRAVEDRDWDPSVKSLVAFPNILARMDENIEWTRRLGDAFLAQEPHVMETVQLLRQKARAAGNLASDDRVRVADDGGAIVIAPANPQVVYVPYYDPWVVYGPWWWPAYAPVYWAPWPGYVVVHRHYPWRPAPAVVGFGWGPAIGVSVGFFFGDFDWRHRHARVVHVNNYYIQKTVIVNRETTRARFAPGRWEHNPRHRRGVAYRDARVQQRFAAADPLPAQRAAPVNRTERKAQPERQEIRRPEPQRREVQRPEPPRREVQRPEPKRQEVQRAEPRRGEARTQEIRQPEPQRPPPQIRPQRSRRGDDK